MKLLDAARLERGTEIRALNPHPLGGKIFKVTTPLVGFGDRMVVKVCTNKGVVFRPEQIEVVKQAPDLAAMAAAADEAFVAMRALAAAATRVGAQVLSATKGESA